MHDKLHRTVAYLAVLDVLLMFDGTVDKHLKVLGAIGTLDNYCLLRIHDPPPDTVLGFGK
jgi:hypothetical protein